MDPESNNSQNSSSKFGRVIKALHNKVKIPSLRTYRGDVSDFIKQKNESVMSITVKEKKRQQEREEKTQEQERIKEQMKKEEKEINKKQREIEEQRKKEEEKIAREQQEMQEIQRKQIEEENEQENKKIEEEKIKEIEKRVQERKEMEEKHRIEQEKILEEEAKIKKKIEEESKKIKLPGKNKKNLYTNIIILISSLLLVTGGVLTVLYVLNFLNTKPTTDLSIEVSIIPYNNITTLANVTEDSLGVGLNKLATENGVNLVKISDSSGVSLKTAEQLFSFLNLSLPVGLIRTLQDNYNIGIFSKENRNYPFLILTVDDFGVAFSAMIEWEKYIFEDLAFLNVKPEVDTEANNISRSIIENELINTNEDADILINPEVFAWKDVIIKNKDTRGLVNGRGETKLVYTFLDKNTILITNNIHIIGNLTDTYASRAVVR
ncbi:MAG: hypothetical protein JW740_02425 [Candidatus Zambryskibacteria bacterium]|nr:hypothetical protein [Candidatus Zambryskibacteria bacterium]